MFYIITEIRHHEGIFTAAAITLVLNSRACNDAVKRFAKKMQMKVHVFS